MDLNDNDFSGIVQAVQRKDEKIVQMRQSLIDMKTEFEKNWSIIEQQELQTHELKLQIETIKENIEETKLKGRSQLVENEKKSLQLHQYEEKDSQIIQNIHELESYTMTQKFNISKLGSGASPSPQNIALKQEISSLESILNQLKINKQKVYSEIETSYDESKAHINEINQNNFQKTNDLDKKIYELQAQKDQLIEALRSIEAERLGALKVCKNEEQEVLKSSPIVHSVFLSLQEYKPKLQIITAEVNDLENQVKEKREEINSLQMASQKTEEAADLLNSNIFHITTDLEKQSKMIEINNQKIIQEIGQKEQLQIQKEKEIQDFKEREKKNEDQVILIEKYRTMKHKKLKKHIPKQMCIQQTFQKKEEKFQIIESKIQEKTSSIEAKIKENQEKQLLVENGIEQINDKIKKYDELMKKNIQKKIKLNQEIEQKERIYSQNLHNVKIQELQNQLNGISIALQAVKNGKEKRITEINNLRQENKTLLKDTKCYPLVKEAYSLLIQEMKKRNTQLE